MLFPLSGTKLLSPDSDGAQLTPQLGAVLPYQLRGCAEGTDDDLRVEAFLHVGLHLLQKLSGKQSYRRGPITNLHREGTLCVTHGL